MKQLPNWILISGSGRNVGKTTLSCRILKYWQEIEPIGVKVSAHIHPLPENSAWIIRKENITLTRETSISEKDSSRMMQSGAYSSYYVQAEEKFLKEALEKLTLLTSGHPVVCESGGMANYLKPGIHLHIQNKEEDSKPVPEWLEINNIRTLTPAEAQSAELTTLISFHQGSWIFI